MQKIALLFIMSFISSKIVGQSTYVPLNSDYYHLIDRYEIKSGKFAEGVFANFKPYTRKSVAILAEKILYNDSLNLFDNYSDKDVFNLQNLMADNWEWTRSEHAEFSLSKKPLWGTLFKRKADTYSFQNAEHDFHVSPIFNFSVGTETNNPNNLLVNTRGIEIRGTINRKLGFYTQLTENQVLAPLSTKDFVIQNKAFPGEGFVKFTTNKTNRNLLADYFSARGYITFNPIKAIQLQFGHDKNIIGTGSQSVMLSDFSAPYLFLKAQTSIGRIQYTNVFAQLINAQEDPKLLNAGDQSQIPTKYLAIHRLGVNFTKNINVGFFESISFGKRRIGFDPNYLNPAIFYRFVEGHLGSPDNSMVGIDTKVNLRKTVSIYGQFVLDEFKLDSVQKSKGWRANKYGIQFGFKYIDLLNIKNLDLQLEHNRVRPYTFQHFSTYSSYVHYNQPLAHPFGANFSQTLLILRYQPIKKLFVSLTGAITDKGLDDGQNNWGGNLLLNYEKYPREFGNFIGQGQLKNINYMEMAASYMILHNLFADFTFINRRQDSINDALDRTNTSFQFGLRFNTARRQGVL